MTIPRRVRRDSWNVKLRRAKEHFDEFEAETARYLESHPYEIRREHQGKPKVNHWRYVLRVTQEPDRLATIMGDVLHNTRAALDHIFCAMLPRKRRRDFDASFPVVRCSIWLDEAGQIQFGDHKTRQRFDSAVEGLQADSITELCRLQPGVVKTPDLHPLGVLSRLENLDKHRDLIPLIFTVRDARSIVVRSGEIIGGRWLPPLCEDGAVVERFGFHPRSIPPETEVSVEVDGTPEILMKRPVKDPKAPPEFTRPSQLLRILVEDIPKNVIPALEPLVRP